LREAPRDQLADGAFENAEAAFRAAAAPFEAAIRTGNA
jgi:hypothetical protein